LPPAPHRPTRVENEYFRQGYKSARRVFWIMDNGSAHRGQKAIDRFHAQWPNAILVHTPVHASWLNQVEIYFRLSSARFSRRTISLLWLNSNGVFSLSNPTMSRQQAHSSGPSPEAIYRLSWPSLMSNDWLRQPDRKYVTVILNQTTKLGMLATLIFVCLRP